MGSDLQPNRTRLLTRSGFSLVELLGVLVILSLLATLVTLGVQGHLLRSRQKVARMDMAAICDGLDVFQSETNRYPTDEEGISVLYEKSDKFPDGIMSRRSSNKDPWGHEYVYIAEGDDGNYLVLSYGADGREGGTAANADITSRDLTDSR
jgi:general secretion pathway protein G